MSLCDAMLDAANVSSPSSFLIPPLRLVLFFFFLILLLLQRRLLLGNLLPIIDGEGLLSLQADGLPHPFLRPPHFLPTIP